MQERDAKVGVQLCQRPLQLVRQHLGVADESLHLGLAEIAAVRPPKTAAEALGTGDANPNAVDVDGRRLTFKDPDARVLEDATDLSLAVGVVVVVAEHRYDR